MFQNANWFRVTAFVIGYIGLMIVFITMDTLGFVFWMAGAVVLFRKPLQRWVGFRNNSEVLTNPQQIASARSEEKAADTVMKFLVFMFFIVGVIFTLLDYNILPQGPLFSTPR